MLDCCCFTARHTGEQIACAFEKQMKEYTIRQKISYIITNNAASMKHTFKVYMPLHSDESESAENNLDDEHLWEDMNVNMFKKSQNEEPFSHSVYFLATMLNHQFGLNRVDLDFTDGGSVPSSQKKFRDELKKTLIG